MTLEELYSQYEKQTIQGYQITLNTIENLYRNTSMKCSSNNPKELIEYLNENNIKLNSLQNTSIPTLNADIQAMVKPYFSKLEVENKKELDDIHQKYFIKQENIKNERRLKLNTNKDRIEEKKKVAQQQLGSLIEKIDELSSYKEKIENVMHTYSINAVGIDITLNKLTPNELEDLVNSALYVCRHTTGQASVVRRILKYLYLPIEKKNTFHDKLTIIYFGVFVLLMSIFKNYILPVISIVYIIALFSSLFSVHKKEKLYQLAYALMFHVDIEQYIEEDEGVKQALEDAEVYLGTTDEEILTQLEEEKEKEIEAFHMSDTLNADKVKFRKLCNNRYENLQTEINTMYSKTKDIVQSNIKRLQEELKVTEEHLYKLTSNYKFLGSTINRQQFLGTEIVLGILNYKGKELLEYKEALPFNNLIFLSKNEEMKQKHCSFIKLLILNYLLNIREKKLKIEIYDAVHLGKDFAELFRPDIMDFIILKNLKLDAELDNIVEECKNRKLKLGTKDIQSYNRENAEIGKVTEDYKIFIILSAEIDIMKNQKLKALYDYSNEVGIALWTLIDDSTAKGLEYNEFIKNRNISVTPGNIQLNQNSFGQIPQGIKPIEYTIPLAKKCLNKYIKTIKENKFDILDYEDSYRYKLIPYDKIWSFSTRKGIELHFGFEDGDPSRPTAMILGDNNVHGLMGGETGAGKSATINLLLMNLWLMYPPSELSMVMIDFKNVEFVLFSGEFQVPHPQIVAGTKDPEYALSVFEWVKKEMEKRQAIFSHWNVKKVEEYNDNIDIGLIPTKRNKLKSLPEDEPYVTETYMPRILFLIDEYQVMFQEVEDKFLDQIKKNIVSVAKLGRAMGIHMFFTSQSMTGTMSVDIMDQFTLRCALACSSDTSVQILGNKAASTLSGKGYIYTNTSGGKTEKENHLFRIPYVDTPDIKMYVKILQQKCKDVGEIDRKAIFYDEKEIVDYGEITSVYNEYGEKVNLPGIIYIGQPAAYTINRLPQNFILKKEIKNNVLVDAFETSAMVRLINTFLENFTASNSDSRVIVSSLDRNLNILLGIEDRVEEIFKPFVHPEYDITKILDLLERSIESRIKECSTKEMPRIYFLAIMWDQLDGLSDNYRLQESIKNILNLGPKTGIHSVFFIKELKPIRFAKDFFNRIICSYCNQDESYNIINSNRASKMSSDFVIYQYGKTEWKAKLYKYPYLGTLENDEVVMTW